MARLAFASVSLLLIASLPADAASPARRAGAAPQVNPLLACTDVQEARFTTDLVLLTANCRSLLAGGASGPTSLRRHYCTGEPRSDGGRLACAAAPTGQLGPTNGTGRARAGGSWRTSCGLGEEWFPIAGPAFTYARCPSSRGWRESGLRASDCPSGRLKNDNGLLACE